jgi:electron transfer flavoprotein beta subunit
MQIYVCVKHVPDSAATITIREKNQIDEGVTFLLNPYDEHAVEEAAKLKAQIENSEVIAVTLGKEGALNTLQSALAMGADRGILIKSDDRVDSILTARALKAAIEQDGRPDIIFTGKQSIDSEGMQTMFRLAAMLDMQAGVRQILEIQRPCVIAAGKDLNKPRYPTFIDIRNAKKKEIRQISLDSLKLEKSSASMEILELKPAVEQRQAKELKGQPQEVVEQLIQVLRDEAKVI